MLIRSTNDKIDVTIHVRNSKDNAYNTKVTLGFTPNINFINVEVRPPPQPGLLSTHLQPGSHTRVRFCSVSSDRHWLLSARR